MASHALGQAVTATLVGQVSDASGSAVAGADVSITNQETGVTTSHPANDSGNYEFTFLSPGVYAVSVRHDGFDVSVTKDVPVAVNTTVRLDAKLNVGSVSHRSASPIARLCCKPTAPMSAVKSTPSRSVTYLSVTAATSSRSSL